MKIVLATGIYPPTIGGPATYVKALAGEMTKKGHEVMVVTYGAIRKYENTKMRKWDVIYVSRSVPIVRWFLYAWTLRKHGKDADAIIAFSSVSVGVPLWMARLKKPKKFLRLGGDFFWERYTDRGGKLGLREWCGEMRKCENAKMRKWMMGKLLKTFDHIVFSTKFQEELYEKHFRRLPAHSVIENALPDGSIQRHEKHSPFRLLFMGRMVRFKNLEALLCALVSLPSSVTLALAGNGPMKQRLMNLAWKLRLENTVIFIDSVSGTKKQEVFNCHDLLVLPSLTELSPNVALEARSAGLPVLLTIETGLSNHLAHGMVLADLSTPEKIMQAIADVIREYDRISIETSLPSQKRTWEDVACEWEKVCRVEYQA